MDSSSSMDQVLKQSRRQSSSSLPLGQTEGGGGHCLELLHLQGWHSSLTKVGLFLIIDITVILFHNFYFYFLYILLGQTSLGQGDAWQGGGGGAGEIPQEGLQVKERSRRSRV